MKNLLASTLLFLIAFSANAAEPTRRELLMEMFAAMGATAPADEAQFEVYERHLSARDIKEVIAFLGTPAGAHLVAAIRESSSPLVEVLEVAMEDSKEKRTMSDLRTLAVSVEAYALDHDTYPEVKNLDGLAKAVTPTYLRSMVRVDGWGKEYVYIGAPMNYRILSAGPDGKWGRDSLKLGTKKGEFGDDLIYSDGEFVQPEGEE